MRVTSIVPISYTSSGIVAEYVCASDDWVSVCMCLLRVRLCMLGCRICGSFFFLLLRVCRRIHNLFISTIQRTDSPIHIRQWCGFVWHRSVEKLLCFQFTTLLFYYYSWCVLSCLLFCTCVFGCPVCKRKGSTRFNGFWEWIAFQIFSPSFTSIVYDFIRFFFLPIFVIGGDAIRAENLAKNFTKKDMQMCS